MNVIRVTAALTKLNRQLYERKKFYGRTWQSARSFVFDTIDLVHSIQKMSLRCIGEDFSVYAG